MVGENSFEGVGAESSKIGFLDTSNIMRVGERFEGVDDLTTAGCFVEADRERMNVVGGEGRVGRERWSGCG